MKKMAALMLATGWTGVAAAGGLGFYGAYWSPHDGDSGYGLGAHLQMDISSTLALEARGSFFEDLTADLRNGTRITEYNLEATPLELGVIIKINVADAALRPYIGGGLGYYVLDIQTELSNGGSVEVDIDDQLGWYVVGGLSIKLSGNIAFLIEAQYRSLEATAQDDDLDEVFTEVDYDLTGIGANAGLQIRW